MLDPEQILFNPAKQPAFFPPEEQRLKREVQALKANQNQTSHAMKNVKVITRETKYDLLNEENPHRTPPQTILFIKKEERDGVEHVIHNGTTSESVIDVLLHRTKSQYVNLEGKGSKAKKKKLENAMKQLKWARDNIVEVFSKEEEE